MSELEKRVRNLLPHIPPVPVQSFYATESFWYWWAMVKSELDILDALGENS